MKGKSGYHTIKQSRYYQPILSSLIPTTKIDTISVSVRLLYQILMTLCLPKAVKGNNDPQIRRHKKKINQVE